MIDRYRTDEMNRIWSDENRFAKWLDVELAVCRAWAEEGVIPAEDMAALEERSGFDVERIAEIESVTQHDVIAFVSAVAERVGPSGRFIHLGLTSSDVIDTAASLLLSEAMLVVIDAARGLRSSIAERAWEYRHTPAAGRSHGIHAEPTTFGLKLLGHVSEVERDIARLSQTLDDIKVCKISGAVGTYANCPPHIEEKVAAALGLRRDPVSTQIIQRDRHARLMTDLAIYGSGLERLAVEIRHLQRTEVMEVSEPFGKGQKGSSAMPHKKNPILSERVSGMARLLRGYASASLESVSLWHERDISHSSVERVIWPDAFHLTHYMTETMKRIIDGLVVNEPRIRKNLDITRGLLSSGRVLLALVEWGMSREEAYAIVQDNAMRCWDAVRAGDSSGSLLSMLESDPRMSSFIASNPVGLDEMFDIEFYLRYVDDIFRRFSIFDDKITRKG
ncbi:MAG: adenylosuccinate lyase [Synergistaceae bacterium]|jgi:adenylosuccinate lyase|nr:adenylosuccinate lyase [Synergistaceae bacterium]